MGFADSYISRQKGFNPKLFSPPSEKLRFAVVIPAYCEPFLLHTLDSLWKCRRPKGHTEIIIVINSPENADPQVVECNNRVIRETLPWIKDHDGQDLRFHLIEETHMPAREAGVGLARKTGMDEALYRFNRISKQDGWILSFDADSLCDDNYFTAIEEAVDAHPRASGFDVYFEHPVSGEQFQQKVYEGITDYELHLRYVNCFLKYSGFPFAHHTVGSCFGVRADIYARQGGMNKRKAGEDFYFLHKVIPLGNFMEINTTRVMPSPRESDRVPFGTGTVVSKYISSGIPLTTYAPEGFLELRQLFSGIQEWYKADSSAVQLFINRLPDSLKTYLSGVHAVEALAEINANCAMPSSFQNRFFRWFDAFRIIKYLNQVSRSSHKQIPVGDAVLQFLRITGKTVPDQTDKYDLLMMMRKMERGF